MRRFNKKVAANLKMVFRGLNTLCYIESNYFIYTMLVSVMTAVLSYVPVYFAARIVDEVTAVWRNVMYQDAGQVSLNKVIVLIVWVVVLIFLLSLVKQMFVRKKDLHENQFYLSEKMMFSDKTMELKYGYLENTRINILKSRIQAESQTGYNMWMFYDCMSQILQGAVSVGISGFFIIRLLLLEGISAIYKITFVVVIFLLIFINFVCDLKENQLSNQLVNQWSSLNMWDDYYNNLLANYHTGKDIRIFGLNQVIRDNYSRLKVKYNKLYDKTSMAQMKYVVVRNIFSLVLNAVAYSYIIIMCVEKSVTVGNISAYVAYILMFVQNVKMVLKVGQDLSNNNQYLERYYEYLDLDEEHDANKEKSSSNVERETEKISADIKLEFRNVSFKYPNSERYIFRKLNVTLYPRQRIAIVGKNGSGKTTFIKLLCRLYAPTEGEILLNGVSIQEYDYDTYIKNISAVFQDFKLFSFPLAQNVAVSQEYDSKRVWECLQKAGGDAAWLKDVNHTYLYKDIMDDGIEISGGEAQKVALARAIYKDSPIVILDEPTAAMDALAEQRIFENFNKIVGDKTVLFISHRLASCKFCDRILVFDAEGIVQYGTHEKLIAEEGLYQMMWKAQTKYYDVG